MSNRSPGLAWAQFTRRFLAPSEGVISAILDRSIVVQFDHPASFELALFESRYVNH